MVQPLYIERIESGTGSEPNIRRSEFARRCPDKERRDDWVREIQRLLKLERGGTMELAHLVCCVRSQLRGGEWSALWKERGIPFSKRKGDMLVTIGRELGNLDEQNLAQLPFHWSVLYEIALLGASTVVRLIAEGVIHPLISLHEAAGLRRKKTKEGGPSIEKALRRLEEIVRRAGPALSQRCRAACATTLNRLATEILAIETKKEIML